ncbi:hypothetical protein [Sphingobacterium siyangense]|uniref:hypothetical protein n=1 Tax=Sphingobacterium TaxID=28453 RepID=UPI003DA2C59B
MLNKDTFFVEVSKKHPIETIHQQEFFVQWSKETQLEVSPSDVIDFFHKISLGADIHHKNAFKQVVSEIKSSVLEYHAANETAETLASKLKFLDYLAEFVDEIRQL